MTSPTAQAIYTFLPSRAVHHAESDPFAIRLATSLEQVSHPVPPHKSVRKKIFTQNRFSILSQLDGKEILNGILRVSLADTKDASDYNLLAGSKRTASPPPTSRQSATRSFSRPGARRGAASRPSTSASNTSSRCPSMRASSWSAPASRSTATSASLKWPLRPGEPVRSYRVRGQDGRRGRRSWPHTDGTADLQAGRIGPPDAVRLVQLRKTESFPSCVGTAKKRDLCTGLVQLRKKTYGGMFPPRFHANRVVGTRKPNPGQTGDN